MEYLGRRVRKPGYSCGLLNSSDITGIASNGPEFVIRLRERKKWRLNVRVLLQKQNKTKKPLDHESHGQNEESEERGKGIQDFF